MKLTIYVFIFLQVYSNYVSAEIKKSKLWKNLMSIKAVGGARTLMPLPEITPPPPSRRRYHIDREGRRHLAEDCTPGPKYDEIQKGPNAFIAEDYYDEGGLQTVATVIIPEHLDHKHFDVTTQSPYLTVGLIDALGYHPSTVQSDHPSECEKIYQDFMGNNYSEESTDNEEESVEMARVPIEDYPEPDQDSRETPSRKKKRRIP